ARTICASCGSPISGPSNSSRRTRGINRSRNSTNKLPRRHECLLLILDYTGGAPVPRRSYESDCIVGRENRRNSDRFLSEGFPADVEAVYGGTQIRSSRGRGV